ncbi:hypothetical protein RsTz2092_08400 [Deferribacterales bacterium RsTz2092]|nr:hypothetical protein AGMMS49941_05700 [Deferribacterales bacterium]
MNKFSVLILTLSFLSIVLPAHAYLDPSSGSMLFQGLAAIGVAFAIFWRKVKRIFTRGKDAEKTDDKVISDLIKGDK